MTLATEPVLPTVPRGTVTSLLGLVGLLVVLEAAVGLSGPGWTVGLACGVALNAAVVVGLARSTTALGPADLVTLGRATLACAVAALTTEALLGDPHVPALVVLATVALALDAVDGKVARRTGTVSRFGGRFDGEVDAFLMLVLSVDVALGAGPWVLSIGLVRYAFAAAGWALPWLRGGDLPFRYWRKVVTATSGIVLVVAAAGVLPGWAEVAGLLAVVVLLAEAFGRDVGWLWRRRRSAPGSAPAPEPSDEPGPARRPWRRALVLGGDLLAVALVWFALVAPHESYRYTPEAFLRIPVEGLVVVALAVVLPRRWRRVLGVVVGLALAAVSLLKVLDIGFFAAFDRPFDPVSDRGYFDSAMSLAQDSLGRLGADLAVVGVALLVLLIVVGLPLAVVRLSGLAARRRTTSLRTVALLGAAWVAFALAGVSVAPGQPVAAADAGTLAVDSVRSISAGVEDERAFQAAAAVDRLRDTPGRDLLGALRGKDVLLVFVESYGKVAVQDGASAPQVQALLRSSTQRLEADGYGARSAFLTSPTFGGLSWLAHATLQSGLWVDNQSRYDRLLDSRRLTLSSAFGRAGWRTVGFLPSNTEPWPEGERFYGFDKVYGLADLDYHGPKFGFSRMPDQFALERFQQRELGRDRSRPLMAEIDLASSHTPWAPLPEMVDWSSLGDGTVYEPIFASAEFVPEVWKDPAGVEAAYSQSIRYTMDSLVQFVQRYGDDDTVVVLLGDHQPAPVVSGHDASHDVPITIVAHDRDVLRRVSGMGWQSGMLPGDAAPVWPMDAFRDRFIDAFSPQLPRNR